MRHILEFHIVVEEGSKKRGKSQNKSMVNLTQRVHLFPLACGVWRCFGEQRDTKFSCVRLVLKCHISLQGFIEPFRDVCVVVALQHSA